MVWQFTLLALVEIMVGDLFMMMIMLFKLRLMRDIKTHSISKALKKVQRSSFTNMPFFYGNFWGENAKKNHDLQTNSK